MGWINHFAYSLNLNKSLTFLVGAGIALAITMGLVVLTYVGSSLTHRAIRALIGKHTRASIREKKLESSAPRA